MKSLLQLFALLVAVVLFATTARAQQAPISNQQQLIFPIVSIGAVGGDLHFQTSFHFQNRSNSTFQGELAFFDKSGADSTAQLACAGDVLIPAPQSSTASSPPAGDGLSPVPPAARLLVEVPADGVVRRAGVVATTLIEGWAVFNWEGAPDIEAAVELALIDAEPADCTPLRDIPSEDVVTSVVIPATNATNEFRVPIVRREGLRETAVAIAAANNEVETTVVVTFLNSEGEFRATNTVFFDPLHSQSLFGFDWELFEREILILAPRPPEDFIGTLVITSDQPIVVGAIDILFGPVRFLTVPIRKPVFPPFPL